MAEYRKLKCVFCGYEQVSKSEKARCVKCNSRRLNVIPEFSVEKLSNKRSENIKVKQPDDRPLKINNSEVETMNKDEEKKPYVTGEPEAAKKLEKQLEKAKPDDEFWGDDEEEQSDDSDDDDVLNL